MLERRPGVFAFAHLTFQEYLAACALYAGNQSGVDAEHVIRAHQDPRWQEVIALYCGVVPAPVARVVIEELLTIDAVAAGLIAEVYLSAGPELAQEVELRRRIIQAVAQKPGNVGAALGRFPEEEVAPIANETVGRTVCSGWSEVLYWLINHPDSVDVDRVADRLRNRSGISDWAVADLNYLVHFFGDSDVLLEVAKDFALYATPHPSGTGTQAETSVGGLLSRSKGSAPNSGADAALLEALRAMVTSP